ncbi:hypothetical protein Syun_025086 [Stephania yunnanensis]|uniref:Zinc finger PHD-type domain-containing protein n=1 Tax=Stephania yunnanensis TaxID=152371 RepID=A0AAP0HVG4_9MAGN
MAESETLENDRGGCCNKWNRRLGNRVAASASAAAARRNSGIRSAKTAGEKIKISRKLGRSLDDHVRVWIAKKMESSGVSESECRLPFLVKAPRMVQCSECGKFIYSEKKLCSVAGCERAYHLKCAKEVVELSAFANFKCPQHACFICRQKGYWRCIRCSIASHTKCAPWPDKVRYFRSQLRRAVCWRHPTDWRFEKEIFLHLPLPYTEEEFRIDLTWKQIMANECEPTPYIHINRSIQRMCSLEAYLPSKRNVNGETRAGLFATQFIEAGRELTFDYR